MLDHLPILRELTDALPPEVKKKALSGWAIIVNKHLDEMTVASGLDQEPNNPVNGQRAAMATEFGILSDVPHATWDLVEDGICQIPASPMRNFMIAGLVDTLDRELALEADDSDSNGRADRFTDALDHLTSGRKADSVENAADWTALIGEVTRRESSAGSDLRAAQRTLREWRVVAAPLLETEKYFGMWIDV